MGLLSCSNAQSDYLKPFGYGTLALPKASVQPLIMLAKRGGRLSPIGPLFGTFNAGASPLPSIARGPVAGISGAKTRSLNAALGLDILGAAIGALAGSALGFKAAYKDASKVEFEFGKVFENRVDFIALDAFMASAQTVAAIGPAMQKLLEQDEVFVVTATVDSNMISVKGTTSSGTDLGLSVPVVQQLVGANITVATGTTGSSVMTYSSNDIPLTIGAEVVRLFFLDGKYQIAKLVKPGSANLGANGEPDPADQAPDELIEV